MVSIQPSCKASCCSGLGSGALLLGGQLLPVAAIVACMVVRGAEMIIDALADPEALLVFGAIVTATSTARPLDEFGRPVSGSSYIVSIQSRNG